MILSPGYPEVVGNVYLYDHDEDRRWPGERWSASKQNEWLPGIYASRDAALLAANSGLSISDLKWAIAQICGVDGPGRVVTVEELLAVGVVAA